MDTAQEQEAADVSETWCCLLLPRNVAYTARKQWWRTIEVMEERRLGFKSPSLVLVPVNNTSSNFMNLKPLIKFF